MRSTITLIAITCIALTACRKASSINEDSLNKASPTNPTIPSVTLEKVAEKGVQAIKDRIRSAKYRREWQSRIDFWGQVQDQHGNPIPGASVQFTWTDLSPEGSSTHTVVSDENGMVSLIGRTGKVLAADAEKDGYARLPDTLVAREYSTPTDPLYHIPDPNKPVILRLRKKDPPSPLIYRQLIELKPAPGSKSVAYDLLGQRIVPTNSPFADFVVEMEPGEARAPGDTEPKYWQVVIRAPHGGVQLGQEGLVVAPEQGYHPALTFIGDPQDPQWDRALRQWLFVQSRSNQVHALIHLQVFPLPRQPPAGARIASYYANPTGGRGLEYDPKLDVGEKFYVPRDR